MNPARTVRFVQIGGQLPEWYGYPPTGASAEFEVTRDDGSTFPVILPIRHGDHATIEDIPVWGWDGDRERPTLHPSIRCNWGAGEVFHGFLRAGKIEICADSTVKVA